MACLLAILTQLHSTPRAHTPQAYSKPISRCKQGKGEMAAAAAEEEFDLTGMNEAELRQWVEANPGRVNHRGRHRYTPL
jgi:hypothetical protein